MYFLDTFPAESQKLLSFVVPSNTCTAKQQKSEGSCLQILQVMGKQITKKCLTRKSSMKNKKHFMESTSNNFSPLEFY